MELEKNSPIIEENEEEIEEEQKEEPKMKINLSACFNSLSRERRDHIYRNKTNVPTPGRYRIKYSSIDAHIPVTDYQKHKSSRKVFEPIILEEYPNSRSEFPWQSVKTINQIKEKKFEDLHGNKRTLTDKEAIQKASPLLQKQHDAKKFNDQSKSHDEEEEVSKGTTINISSFGYNYWDPNKLPVYSQVYWPPLPSKPNKKVRGHLDMKNQSNRKQMVKQLKDASYEISDATLSNLSKQKKVKSAFIDKKLSRSTLVGKRTSASDFLSTRTSFASNHSKGFVDFKKQKDRSSFNNTVSSFSNINQTKVQESESNLSKNSKSKSFVNMGKMNTRDDRMYKNSEWYRNCRNEDIAYQNRLLYDEMKNRRKSKLSIYRD